MNSQPNHGRKCGAIVIEFGLVAFLFFLVMWGIFEFGRAFYVVNTTQHLTRCIARSAVVKLPSQSQLAKQTCLMPSGGAGTTWPFFTMSANDLTRVFKITYVTQAGPVDEAAVSTGLYDDQVSACIGPQPTCITDVVAYFDATNKQVETLGLLSAWIQSGSTYTGFEARTTMPAESMGWHP